MLYLPELISVYLATQIHPLKPRKIVEGQITSIREELQSEMWSQAKQLKVTGGGTQSDATGAFGSWYHRLLDKAAMEDKQKQYSIRIPFEIKYADKFWEVKHSYLNSLSRQKKLADNLSRVSPLSLYGNTMSALAGTDVAGFQNFVESVKTHRNRIINYIHSKTENFSATSFFTPCTKEEMEQFDKSLKGQGSRPDTSNTTSLDLRDLPRFSYQPDFIENLQRAIPDLGLLFFINVVFFTLSFAAFVRYDVRSG
ncbi:hypothetical protein ES703_48524 [subsurface metagenome]